MSEATAIVEQGEEAHIVAEVLKNFVVTRLYPPVIKDDSELPESFELICPYYDTWRGETNAITKR